ncbi:Fibrinogen-like protein 1 [Mytilus coruscus]|uniref:Fibrinogen-like protein 1 n=1 Tax=Mytilus coruscus TaxID=42192 RepID=A0A6J8EBW9_MYTCO|nr:Fibrinogen-like protein 1 [Mytilus coruscus]
MKPTIRGKTSNFKTTSDKRSTATTIDRTTENETAAMIIDCSEIPGGSLSGVYTVYIDYQPVEIYCELRADSDTKKTGTTDFYWNWHEYKQGFGNVNFEYWLGNDNLHKILSSKNYKLRIDLEDWNGNAKYADYNTFVVGSEDTNYTLTISGYSGDAGDSIINPPSDSMSQMYGMEFSTSDRDNDKIPFYKAAESTRSGWWLKWSTDANLNGVYYKGGQTASDGIFWKSWQSSQYSLKSVSMKIKPS